MQLGLVVWIVVLIHSMGIMRKFNDNTTNLGPNLAESGTTPLLLVSLHKSHGM